MTTITGTTRITQIIGHPIRQVRAPDLLNADLARHGADTVLVPIDIPPDAVAGFVSLQRAWANSPGFIVTVPHKRAVAALCDRLSPRAARLGAVNIVVRGADGTLAGDHLDGLGCVAAARRHGFDPRGKAALIVGAGGAGSAIADAFAEAGLARLVLRDLDTARVAWVAAALAASFPSLRIEADPGDLSGFDLVVNATPVGMNGKGGLPIPEAEIATLRPGTHVVDVVTDPRVTPFLDAARARGCAVQPGGDMVAAQIAEFGRLFGLFGD